MKSLRAELIADRGAAATGPGFFRCAAFLDAEGVTHTLVIGDGLVALPVIRREVTGGGYDGISPYGYPGGKLRGDPPNMTDVDFDGCGLISLFVRERLGAPTLRGGTARATVRVHDPTRPRMVDSRMRTKARGNERLGYRFEVLAGGSVDDDTVLAFDRIYGETMRRAGAGSRYFFGAGYFRSCLSAESASLAVVRGPDGDLAAAAIAVVSDGCLHSFLTGTADLHRPSSPGKNLMIGMLDTADEVGVPLNLGGGLNGADSLDTFKSRFTNTSWEFVTHRVVCDQQAYARLAPDRGGADFFPAYRATRRTPRAGA